MKIIKKKNIKYNHQKSPKLVRAGNRSLEEILKIVESIQKQTEEYESSHNIIHYVRAL